MAEPDPTGPALSELRRLFPAAGMEIGGRWYEAQALVGEPDIVATLVADHAAFRRIEEGRYAASLFFQRYCHRLCGAVVGVWVLNRSALDASPGRVSMCVRDASPASVRLSGATRPADTPEELVRGLVDEHLLVLAGHLHERYPLTLPNLWGNIAAGIGQAARALSRIRAADEVRAAVEPVLATRPLLGRLGEFRVLSGPQGPRLFYDRRTCCHWHEIPDGKFCSYCSRLSQDERTRRFAASMAGE
ncbi:hypothetical protein [Propionicicella superfundia]|uniref:hypothetical protein n=1 Tax=Propionicicella superfundia TaxID=348582 RepID=UPI000401592E|nr:hypothetical protein [Propionicicella superfundia]